MSHETTDDSVELAVIVNSFSRCALLERAIASLSSALRNARFRAAIVVFEAGSTDGSSEFLQSWRKNCPTDNLIVIEPSASGSSFSAGINTACTEAIDRFPNLRWLFFYETDNYLEDVDPLEQAIRLLKEESALAAAGFTVKQHDGTFFGYGMRFPGGLSFALGQNVAAKVGLHAPNNSKWHLTEGIRWRLCDIVFTSPLLVRREAWVQSGGFDSIAFPFSDSDLDWAWRCAEMGWQMAVIASEQVVHDNLSQLSAWSANRALDFHRNRFRLLKRHRGKHIAFLKPILFLRHWLETLILSCKSATDPSAKEKLAKRKQMLRTVWTNYS